MKLAAAQELIKETVIRAPYERINAKSSTNAHLKTEITELQWRVSINDLWPSQVTHAAELN